MSWTQERINLLVKLWMSGKSASAVATELGNISRNAVIGKVHRLGISNRDTVQSKQSTEKKKKAVKKGKATIKSVKDVARYLRPAPDYIKIKPISATRNTKSSKRHILPTPTRSSGCAKNDPLELNDKSCRWPTGDPRTKNFSFCGCTTNNDSPYCAYHSQIAYVSTGKREPKEPKQHIIINRKPAQNDQRPQDMEQEDLQIDMAHLNSDDNALTYL